MARDDDLLLLLPTDIGREILSRLPVKSILRCRSVCKSWYSLVSCPNFISHYSTRNLNKNGNRVLLRLEDEYYDEGDYHEFLSYTTYDESSTETREHDDIYEAVLGSQLEIVGSCNGLICLSSTRNVYSSSPDLFLHMYIWNPTIRKIVELPPRTLHRFPQRDSYCGFGFDSNTNDYKVLRVVVNINDANGEDFSDTMCEIFDLSKGAWRVICPRVPSSVWCFGDRNVPECYWTRGVWCVGGSSIPQCYLDGVVYWSDCRVLLSFSFSDECFREIKMPYYESSAQYGGYWYNTRAVTFSGSINVIIWTGPREVCSVWTMKEYGVTESWTEVFNIDFREFQDFDTFSLRPNYFCLWKNDEVLMVHAHSVDTEGHSWRRQDLVSYNIERKQFTSLFCGRVTDLCLYEESLVLM